LAPSAEKRGPREDRLPTRALEIPIELSDRRVDARNGVPQRMKQGGVGCRLLTLEREASDKHKTGAEDGDPGPAARHQVSDPISW
jgi:hypothetical protein